MDKKVALKKVPSLDFAPLKKLTRRTSESSIKPQSPLEVEELLQNYRDTLLYIEEIKLKLSEIQKCVKYEDLEIGKEIKEIRNHVFGLVSESERTPRVISRCDAIVKNTQSIMTSSKNVEDAIKSIHEEIVQNDIVTTTLISNQAKELLTLHRKIDQLREAVIKLEKTTKSYIDSD